MNEFAIVDLRHRNRGEGALVKDGSGWGLPNTVKNYNRLSGVVYIGNGTVLIKCAKPSADKPSSNRCPSSIWEVRVMTCRLAIFTATSRSPSSDRCRADHTEP